MSEPTVDELADLSPDVLSAATNTASAARGPLRQRVEREQQVMRQSS